MSTNYLISGRIIQSNSNAGVQGLFVEAWDNDLSPDNYLGSDVTDLNGQFWIRFCPPHSDSNCDACPRVYLKIRDRDCRLIYDGCAERHCCDSDKQQTINVTLPAETLWWHLSRPLSWMPNPEPLVPAGVFDDIQEAAELLPPLGTPSSVADVRLAICATPAIEIFDNILIDAWGSLLGDSNSATRYREILNSLCAQGATCCNKCVPYGEEVDQIFQENCSDDGEHDCKPRCEEPKPCAEEGCGCGCDAPFISNDKALVLLMAALHVACEDTETAKRYVLTLLDQLCRFEMLGALHRASVRAIIGDKVSRNHVRDLLEFLCSNCPPKDPNPDQQGGCRIHRPLNCCETCLDERLVKCLRQAVAAWCCIDCYCITEVRPPRACPGEEIVIVGHGFGERPGRVAFRQLGGLGWGSVVEPTSWCDERITVTVPQRAGCGLNLLLPSETVQVCGRFLDFRRTGCVVKGFEGSSPDILRFTVKGHADRECLEPGEPLRIRWNTCAADRVKIEIINVGTGGVIAVRDPADANGRWDFTATNFNTARRISVRITVTGKCEPDTVTRQFTFVFQRRPNLSVQGLEVTQAIQYYRPTQHLTDPADRGPDNSVRLVTNKTAWVRTYLRSGQDPSFESGQVTGINGTLTVERRVGGIWSVVTNIPSQNGPIVVEDAFTSYDAERRNINSTLNFVVPANIMTGLLRFRVNVASQFQECPGNTASGSVQVDVNLRQTLNAAFITIGYDGPDNSGSGTITAAAPTLATCQAETSWAMTTYPLSGTPNTRLAGTFVTNTPINDPRSCPGCCSPNWGPLLVQVGNLVALDQAANPGGNWVYYGIITNSIPVNVPGCSGWGATGGLEGAPVTYAHEIGHQFGLPHARCGNAGGGNAAYPVYEPYDLPVDPAGTTNWTMASIGEYGLDINNGAIADPIDFEDFMSYCGPRWISLYTYNYLLNLGQLTPVVIPTGSGSASARMVVDDEPGFEADEKSLQPLIHMLGTIDADNNVNVLSVARLKTRYMRGRGRQTGYVAQLLDSDGRILSTDNLYDYPEEGEKGKQSDNPGDCRCSDPQEDQPILFKAMMRDVAPGASLRIVKRGKVLWERRGASKPPAFSRVSASVDKEGNLKVNWKLDAGSDELVEVWARWTNDDGKTWHALTVGQKGNTLVINPEQLPSGYVKIELLGHDGFHTVTAVTEAVNLPPKPPAVSILYPQTSSRVYADREVHLFGTASSYAGDVISDEQATWYLDGERIADGFDVWVNSPEPGRHLVTLKVREGDLEGSAEQAINVIPTDAESSSDSEEPQSAP